MKAALIAATAVVGLTGAALAGGPALMTDDQMDQVVGGSVVSGNGHGTNGVAQFDLLSNQGAEVGTPAVTGSSATTIPTWGPCHGGNGIGLTAC